MYQEIQTFSCQYNKYIDEVARELALLVGAYSNQMATMCRTMVIVWCNQFITNPPVTMERVPPAQVATRQIKYIS
jgi:hypothetical protein